MTTLAPMQDAYNFSIHLGPHSPLSLPLQRVLTKNAPMLHSIEAEYPAPKMHREVLSQLLRLPYKTLAEEAVQEDYRASVLEHENTRTVLFNFDAFLGSRKNSIVKGEAYPSLEKKVGPIRHLTLHHNVSLFVCLQSFATFVEEELKDIPDKQQKLAASPGCLNFSWVPFIERLREAWPEALIVILNADDLPVHWAANVALFSGHPKPFEFKGIENYMLSRLSEDGRKHLSQTLRQQPALSISQWTEMVSEFFEKYGKHEPLLKKLVAGLWTPEQHEYSLEALQEDFYEMEKIENLTMAKNLIKVLK